jgi:hypothetical protein
MDRMIPTETSMKLALLAIALASAALAGCDRDTAEPRAASSAPTTASGGATGSAPTGPAGDTSAQAPAPKQGDTASAEAKPDPGDANDHSNPQHDAKNKKNAD